MLLKSVDHIFWLGRYLERLDDTARLVNATSHLLIAIRILSLAGRFYCKCLDKQVSPRI